MGWGTHPDTLSIAAAQGDANHSGHPEQSLGWLKVYREAYERNSDPSDSLTKYLAGLDARIAEMEADPEPKGELLCPKCNTSVNVLFDGWCGPCGGLRRCRKCREGVYRHNGSPNWMNRFTCDHCNHHVSR